MIDLTNSPIVKVNNDLYEGCYREYNRKIYYCRRSITNYELIISHIAQFLEIDCVNYESAIIDDQLYIISENFIGDGISFKDGYDIIDDYRKRHNVKQVNSMTEEELNNLYSLSKILNKKYGIDSYNMIRKLTDIFAFDLIIGYSDRQSPNWGVLEKSGNAFLAPMYDCKWSFNGYNPKLLVSAEDMHKSLENIIYHFLDTASLNSIKNFERYYKLLNYNQLESIISRVSKINSINYDENRIKKNFIKRKKVITKILQKF